MATDLDAAKEAERLILAGRLAEARPIIVTLCEKDPLDADLWLYLAAIDEQFGFVSEAMAALQQASALDPDAPETSFALVRLLWRDGEVEQAIDRSLTLFNRDPAYVENAIFAARALRLARRSKEAVDIASRALEVSPVADSLWAEYLLSAKDVKAVGETTELIHQMERDGFHGERLRLISARIVHRTHPDLTRRLLAEPFRNRQLQAEAEAWKHLADGEIYGPSVHKILHRFYYDEVSEVHDYHRQPELQSVAKGIAGLLEKHVDVESGTLRLVDVGCATGIVTENLGLNWLQKTGVDLSRKMLKRAVQKNRFDNVVAGDWLEFCKIDSGRYDVLIAIDVIDHSDPFEFLKSCHDALAAGGVAVITSGGHGSTGLMEIGVCIAIPDLAEIAQKSGFELLDCVDAKLGELDGSITKQTFLLLGKTPGDKRDNCVGVDRRSAPRRAHDAPDFVKTGELLTNGEDKAAREILERLSEIHPDKADVWLRLGLAEQMAQNFDSARRAYDKALGLESEHPTVLFQIGTILQTQERLSDALAFYRRAVKADPKIAFASFNMSIVAEQLGDLREAIDSARRAETLEPGNQVFTSRLDRLEAEVPPAIRLECRVADRESIDGRIARGYSLHQQGDNHRVVDILEPVIDEMGGTPAGVALLAAAYRRIGRLRDAEPLLQRFLKARPDDPTLLEALAGLYAAGGNLIPALREWDHACQGLAPERGEHSNRLFLYNYASELDREAIAHAHIGWGRALEAVVPCREHDSGIDWNPGRKLRIGYVSGDFRSHAVNCFFEEVLRHHDPNSLEVFCYSNNEYDDEATYRLRYYADAWRRIRYLDDDSAADLVVNDRIDILVDLGGHTGGNRLPLFARKLAPVQISWIGYPNTTGLSRIDYRITDSWADPRGETEHLHSEKLLRLEDGFHVYSPTSWAISTWTELDPAENRYTFGCCNNMYKVTPEVIRVWSDILSHVPESTLLLRSHSFDNDELYEITWGLFERNGIERDRVRLMSALGYDDHISVLQRTEIGLDPFPYNGTTTTCDMLWMGIPVVTLAGDRHAGRVGVSILTNIGLTKLIAHDPGEYVEIAVGLALDRNRLNEIKAGLRHRMRLSNLMNYAKFTGSLEKSYRSIWREKCSILDDNSHT